VDRTRRKKEEKEKEGKKKKNARQRGKEKKRGDKELTWGKREMAKGNNKKTILLIR